MKKRMVILMATALFAATVPAIAMDHGSLQNHQQQDAQCVKDCELLLRNCAQEADSIQQRIQKLKSAIQNKSNSYTVEQLKTLKEKLEEVQKNLAVIEKGGA